MNWSKEQTEEHARSAEQFREAYLQGRNKYAPVAAILGDRRRCVTLVELLGRHPPIVKRIAELNGELGISSGLYFQEIPHFTVDCHRYLTADKLPAEINEMVLVEQQRQVIPTEELSAYDKILREEVRREKSFAFEVKGVAFGGDGLVAQVWYDNARMQAFNDRIGERVRREVPTMNFQWGIVKNKVPVRVVNLARFTGLEDRKEVTAFVDANKESLIGGNTILVANLLLSDHYIQERNTLNWSAYAFF